MVQRGHNFAIVDEVDSILIDEARTPLIISGPLDDRSELYIAVDALMPRLAHGATTTSTRSSAPCRSPRAGNEYIEELLREAGLLKEGDLYDAAQRHPRPPRQPGAARPHAVPARQGLHRPQRRGGHHRRVHRPHDAGPALLGRPAPGARGQGARHRSSPRTRRSPRSPSRTTSASTRSSPA